MAYSEDGQNRVQQGRSERRGEAYDFRYVEPRSDMRTQLDTIFTILLRMFFDPHFPARRMLQFPNWGDLLQFVDCPFAGPKCVSPMLRSGNDEHDILPDWNFAIAMDDHQLQDIEIFQPPLTGFSQLLLAH